MKAADWRFRDRCTDDACVNKPAHVLADWVMDNLGDEERDTLCDLPKGHREAYLSEIAFRKNLPAPPL